jgi:hypothetical protein
MASTPPMCSPMFLHIAIDITLRAESCISSSASSITRDFSAGSTVSASRMSEMMSCVMCRLSKMIAARGCAAANLGATTAVMGITRGMFRGASSSMDQKRAKVA